MYGNSLIGKLCNILFHTAGILITHTHTLENLSLVSAMSTAAAQWLACCVVCPLGGIWQAYVLPILPSHDDALVASYCLHPPSLPSSFFPFLFLSLWVLALGIMNPPRLPSDSVCRWGCLWTHTASHLHFWFFFFRFVPWVSFPA